MFCVFLFCFFSPFLSPARVVWLSCHPEKGGGHAQCGNAAPPTLLNELSGRAHTSPEWMCMDKDLSNDHYIVQTIILHHKAPLLVGQAKITNWTNSWWTR